MSNKKQSIWMYQLGVYTPPFGVKKNGSVLGGACEAEGVIYPYRKEPFNLYWLAPFHPDRPEYWSTNIEKQTE